jgi:hypothetical protein
MIVWLNADQVAERLSVSRRTALTLMYQMPHSVIGGSVKKRIRVSEGSLDAWMVKQSNKLPIADTMQTGSRRKLKRR